MRKQYRILAMMDGSSANLFDLESRALQMQADKVGQDKPESELLTMYGDVAVIEVKGALTNKNSWYNKYMGLVAYDSIREASMEAVDLGAGSILFDVDSPGGSVSGMKDLSNFVENLDIPTISHTSGLMASAAYFFGISCEKCYADSMSESGSVGVVMTLIEYSTQLEKAGVHAEVFRSGKHKQAGNPYEKLSAENRKLVKSQVMTYANKFYEFVSEKRGIPLPAMDEIKTGRTFIGEEALAAGLVDKIISFDEALAEAVILAEKTLEKDNTNPGGFSKRSYQLNSGALAQGDQKMAKKVSKEYLAALVAAGKETPAPDAADNAENLGEAQVEETETEVEASEEVVEETIDTNEEQPKMVEASKLVEMTDKFDATQVELADALSKLEAAEAEMGKVKEAHAESIKPMVEAICDQISAMRVGLSLAEVDMTGWDAAAIMKEHDNVSKTFESSFVSGGVVPNEDSGKKEPQSRSEVNKIKNLGL